MVVKQPEIVWKKHSDGGHTASAGKIMIAEIIIDKDNIDFYFYLTCEHTLHNSIEEAKTHCAGSLRYWLIELYEEA